MKLTCVTAVFNAVKAGNRDALIRCARSVAALGVSHEHIFVDGASADGTLDVLRELQNEIPSLKVISEKDTGIYNALNKGLKAAQGEWFYVLGCDDSISAPEVLDGLLRDDDRSEVLVAPVEYGKDPNYAFHKIDDLKRILQWIYGYCHQGMLVRTGLARELGGFDESYRLCSDGDMMLKLHKRGSRFRYTFKAFANFAPGGANENARDRVEDETALVLRKHLGLSDEETVAISRMRLPPARVAWRYLLSRDMALRISARYVLSERIKIGLEALRAWFYGVARGARIVYNANDLVIYSRSGYVGWSEPLTPWTRIIWMDAKHSSASLPLPRGLRNCGLSIEMRAMILKTGVTPDQSVAGGADGKMQSTVVSCIEKSPLSMVKFDVPRELNAGAERLEFDLELHDEPVALNKAIEGCPDPRTLGLYVRDIAIFKRS